MGLFPDVSLIVHKWKNWDCSAHLLRHTRPGKGREKLWRGQETIPSSRLSSLFLTPSSFFFPSSPLLSSSSLSPSLGILRSLSLVPPRPALGISFFSCRLPLADCLHANSSSCGVYRSPLHDFSPLRVPFLLLSSWILSFPFLLDVPVSFDLPGFLSIPRPLTSSDWPHRSSSLLSASRPSTSLCLVWLAPSGFNLLADGDLTIPIESSCSLSPMESLSF